LGGESSKEKSKGSSSISTQTPQTSGNVDNSVDSNSSTGSVSSTNQTNSTSTIMQKRTPQTELRDRSVFTTTKLSRPSGQYRPDIPKESKFFKIYGSETAKVNFPVRLLSESEAAKRSRERPKSQSVYAGWFS
jgi:hypothetical protein